MDIFTDVDQSERQRRYALVTGQQVGKQKPSLSRDVLLKQLADRERFKVMEMTTVNVEISPDKDVDFEALVVPQPAVLPPANRESGLDGANSDS